MTEASGTKDHLHLESSLEQFSESAVFLLAPCVEGSPIVAVSAGFCEQTGYSQEDLLGASLKLTLQGLSNLVISRSEQIKFDQYCKDCTSPDVEHVAEISVIQPCSRKDGSVFNRLIVAGLCVVQKPRPQTYVSCVQVPVPSGRLSAAVKQDAEEQGRKVLRQVRLSLCKASQLCPGKLEAPCGFAFYSERLQECALLQNRSCTAVRREASQLPRGCLVFGDRPVQPCKIGLCFTLRIDRVTPLFQGLPLLGFTRREPTDTPGLFPCSVAKCLGQSLLVGGFGEAFARDQVEHFPMQFKQPPEEEVAYWSLQPDLPQHQKEAPATLRPGDILQCRYTWEGRVQLLLNGEAIIDFDVKRPLVPEIAHYAVVDVCFSAESVTLMPDGHVVNESDGNFTDPILGTCSTVIPSDPGFLSRQVSDEDDLSDTRESDNDVSSGTFFESFGLSNQITSDGGSHILPACEGLPSVGPSKSPTCRETGVGCDSSSELAHLPLLLVSAAALGFAAGCLLVRRKD
eukprot:gb/GFBE01060856.1/.p1 GENE.gb/GFBE01060856.1/~~gb/GFBE01060856.1/.p1  ORF type:complete len:514 (+),score=82.16 gb/GFBE01060856.1/:1-1542(+)